MALPPPNDDDDTQHPSFHAFYSAWLVGQNQHLQELNSFVSQAQQQESVLAPLLQRVVEHYDEYYRVKAEWTRRSVLTMLSPMWTSSLEDAHLWIGGWRPTMAFQLLYSVCGLQLPGCELRDIVRGVGPNDLGSLPPTQMDQMDALQSWTVEKERKITEKMAKVQESAAAADMVEMSRRRKTELADAHRLALALEIREQQLEKGLRKPTHGYLQDEDIYQG